MRLLIRESLEQAAFAVAEAEDGLPALAAFEHLRPDVVLLDVTMKDMDGFAVCTALRAIDGDQGTPVVMVTGVNDVASINRAYDVGAVDFITKPINWAVLGHRIRYIVRASRAFNELRSNKESLIKAQRIARLGNWNWDIQNERFSWSGEIYQTFGMSCEASTATYEAFVRCAHPEDRECIRNAFESAVDGKSRLDIEHRVIGPDGQTRFVHLRGEASVDDSGRVACLTGTTQDISDRVQAEATLRLSANALENSAEAVMISDAKGRIVSVNKAFTTMTGYPAEQVIGKSPDFLRSDRHDSAFYSQLWDSVGKTGHWQGEIWARRRNGEVYPQGVSISQVQDKVGRSSHYVSVSSDISRYKQYEAQLAFLAHHDALTDLPNRFAFQTHLREAVLRARRDGSVIALMFIDLDQFKIINDSLGHIVGDLLLKAAAQRLTGCVRQTDLVARLGGDEFVVVLNGAKDPQHAAKIADKLIDVLAEPFLIDGHELTISGSIGISCYPQDGADADVLLKNADAAMYRAKELGRNNYQFFCVDMGADVVKQLVMTNSLRVALNQKQFLLHYQPRIDLASRRIIGVEALVRWQHPEKGLLAPARFISHAEETGLIGPLGEWVLRTACKQAKAWHESGLGQLRMAVNLSARQFRQPNFAQQIAAILAETGVDASLLELEITESMVMQDLEKTKSILDELTGLRIAIAIDDFGTGHSSLAYLKRFPVEYLKIDRSFIRDLPGNQEDAAITKAIIALGKSLKLRVIAEGIETQSQQSFLELHGCDEGQGYLISQPLAAADLDAILRGNLRPESDLHGAVAA
jgi:diguanylate cyclase (GGDEF)-like protein/PAS domain S-box-containing protein